MPTGLDDFFQEVFSAVIDGTKMIDWLHSRSNIASLRRKARKVTKDAEVHLINGEYREVLRDFYTVYRHQRAITERFFILSGARLHAWADCVEISFLALWVIHEGDLPQVERNKWRKKGS
jgi:hypothetical protein